MMPNDATGGKKFQRNADRSKKSINKNARSLRCVERRYAGTSYYGCSTEGNRREPLGTGKKVILLQNKVSIPTATSSSEDYVVE